MDSMDLFPTVGLFRKFDVAIKKTPRCRGVFILLSLYELTAFGRKVLVDNGVSWGGRSIKPGTRAVPIQRP